MGKISVFIKEPGKELRHVHISDTLENLQKIVGGYIETWPFANDATVICNEEGLLRDMPFSCVVLNQPFYGTIIFAGVKGDDFADFPAADIKEFHKLGLMRDLY